MTWCIIFNTWFINPFFLCFVSNTGNYKKICVSLPYQGGKKGKKETKSLTNTEKKSKQLEAQFWGNTWDWSIRRNSVTNSHMWHPPSPAPHNPGCHQSEERRPCSQASVQRLGPCGAGELTPLTERGGSSRKPQARLTAGLRVGTRAAPPGPARSAQRDSALTHRARCQWISPSAAPACLSSPPPAPRALSCTPGQSLRFRQSSGADFTAFESRPKQGSDWLCFFWL